MSKMVSSTRRLPQLVLGGHSVEAERQRGWAEAGVTAGDGAGSSAMHMYRRDSMYI